MLILSATAVATAGERDTPPCLPDTGSPGQLRAPSAAGVVVRASFSPRPLRAGETVHWMLRVTNSSGARRRLVFPTSQVADVMLRRGGRIHYRWAARKVFTTALTHRELEAGETWTCRLSGRLDVKPGRYELVALLTITDRKRPTFRRPSVLVTVR